MSRLKRFSKRPMRSETLIDPCMSDFRKQVLHSSLVSFFFHIDHSAGCELKAVSENEPRTDSKKRPDSGRHLTIGKGEEVITSVRLWLPAQSSRCSQ
jgi:hypothetical protein